MTLKKRRFLFYFLVIVFAAAGATIIFYSQGWRLTVKNGEWKIQKTGAIYIETKPAGVVIKIDKKIHKDKSGVIQGGTLIRDLLPKKYELEISKNGYLSWQKNIEVKPEFVAEAIGLILIPNEIKSEAVPIRLRGEEFAGWSGNGKFIIKNTEAGIYYLYDLNDPATVFNATLNFKNLKNNGVIENLAFHPFDSNKLIVETKKGLAILDILRLKTENISSSKPIAWTVQNPNVYYVKENYEPESKTKKYNLYSFNLMLKTENVVAELDDRVSSDLPIKLAVSGSRDKIAVLNDSNDLYLFDFTLNNFNKISDGVKDFAFSPDNKKLAFSGANSKIGVYFLKDWTKNIIKKKGEIADLNFNLKDGEEIKKIYWHGNSYHLFVESSDADDSEKIAFVEIDNRPPLNQYDLFTGIADFHYEQRSGALYYIKENSLYFSEIFE